MFTSITSVAVLLASTLLLNPTLAAPTVSDSSLKPRAAASSGTCDYFVNFNPNFHVVLHGTGAEDAGTCQGGFLDNLRGQCGYVADWGCDSNGQDADVTFKLSALAGLQAQSCVQNAIYLSQNKLEGVTCVHLWG
jgi:hypothetical protein